MRNPPPPSDSGPPYPDPYSGYGPAERPYQAPHSGPPFSYPHPPHHDRGRPPPPPQPYPSQRDALVRMSPAPLEVPPPSGQANSLYHPEAGGRDRYPPDAYYPPGAQPPPMRAYVTRVSHLMGSPSAFHRHACVLATLNQSSSAWVPGVPAQPGLPAQTPAGAVVTAGGEEGHLASTIRCLPHSVSSLPQRLCSRGEHGVAYGSHSTPI